MCEELLCSTPTLLPTPLLHLPEWRSCSQPCLPLPLDTPKFLQGGTKVKTGWWKWCPVCNLLLDQFSLCSMEAGMRVLGTAAFFGAIFTSSCCLSCFCSLLMSALMKLESQTHRCQRENGFLSRLLLLSFWLSYRVGSCVSRFLCVRDLGLHSSTSSCSSGLSVHLDHIRWNGSAGRAAAGRKPLLLCLMQERSAARSLHRSQGKSGATVWPSPTSGLRYWLIPSLWSLSVLSWCLESKWRNCRNLWGCLAELPLPDLDLCVGTSKVSVQISVTYLPITIKFKGDLQHRRRGSGSCLFLYRH